MSKKAASSSSDRYRRVAGRPLAVLLEPATDPERIDHVWVTLDLGDGQTLRAVINTMSLRNKAVGFDDRVSLGLVRTTFDELPPPGISPAEGLDYDVIAASENVFFETCERRDLELLFCDKLRLADCVEVWGELFDRTGPGIHQIHSRRASCAVTEDIRGRDGAFKCYFLRDKTAELYLVKFCGQ